MEVDLVSVVIPTYNRAYCVGRAIESVRKQSHTNWELILVDDGSTDNTAEFVSLHYSSDPRIRYIHQGNAGVSVARNTGISAARGNFIALLDSDDAWKPWKLELQLACFRAFPEVGMVWTEFEAVDASGQIVNQRYLRTMYGAYRFYPASESLFANSREISSVGGVGLNLEPGTRAYVGNIYTAMLRGNLVHTSTVMLSRERMEKVKGFDAGLALSGEDYDFHFRTCKWGSVCFADIPSTIYQLEYDDRLTKYKLRIAENFLRTVQKAVERERGTDQFPATMVREVLTEAHGWIAEELFREADTQGARRHALSSLQNKLWQPRMMMLFSVTLIRYSIFSFLLAMYRRTKHILKHKS
jgi:glycosyltransferase involved in cell wall biosynthesis